MRRISRGDHAADPRPPAPPLAGVVLAALGLPLAALVLAIQVLASGPYLRFALTRPGYPADPGFSREERLALALPSTRFIVRRDPPRALEELRHRDAPLYTPAEIEHLVDVRRVVAGLHRSALLLGLLALATLALRPRALRAGLARGLRAGGLLLLAGLLGLGLAVTLAWDASFTWMHRLLFAEGTWQFARDAALIRLFPDRFWYDTALLLVGLMALQGLAALWIGRRLRPGRP